MVASVRVSGTGQAARRASTATAAVNDVDSASVRRLAAGMTEHGQTTSLIPSRRIPDTERLTNGAVVLRCGESLDAIRAPYRLGVTAFAMQRRCGVGGGDVIAHRRQHVYFLIPPGLTVGTWETLGYALGAPMGCLRLLGAGAYVVIPSREHNRTVRWLRGPGHGPASCAADVLATLAHAEARLRERDQNRDAAGTDSAVQESAELLRRAMLALPPTRRRLCDDASGRQPDSAPPSPSSPSSPSP